MRRVSYGQRLAGAQARRHGGSRSRLSLRDSVSMARRTAQFRRRTERPALAQTIARFLRSKRRGIVPRHRFHSRQPSWFRNDQAGGWIGLWRLRSASGARRALDRPLGPRPTHGAKSGLAARSWYWRSGISGPARRIGAAPRERAGYRL